MLTYVSVAYEDQLTLAVIQKLFQLRDDLVIGDSIDCNGYGKIKKRVRSYNLMAKNGKPAFVITDLDMKNCPLELISDWLGGNTLSTHLLFRIAVREIESWVLADTENIARFFGIKEKAFPDDTDTLPDPKNFLIQRAKDSKRKAVKGIIPRNDSAVIGLEYNSLLCQFVQKSWEVENAVRHSPSLNRTVERLKGWEL